MYEITTALHLKKIEICESFWNYGGQSSKLSLNPNLRKNGMRARKMQYITHVMHDIKTGRPVSPPGHGPAGNARWFN